MMNSKDIDHIIFYRDKYRAEFKKVWLLAIVIVLLVILVIYNKKESDDFIKKQEEQITDLEKQLNFYKDKCEELEVFGSDMVE